MPIALSRYSLEDGQIAQAIIDDHEIECIVLVTSDFHMPRTKFVFTELFNDIIFEYALAKTFACVESLIAPKHHEKVALAREKVNLSVN